MTQATMRIDAQSNALSNGLSGIEAAKRRIGASSHNVANMLTEDFRPLRAFGEDVAGGGARTVVEQAGTPAPVDLAREFVESDLAVVAGKASARVMETELELLGSVLDLRT